MPYLASKILIAETWPIDKKFAKCEIFDQGIDLHIISRKRLLEGARRFPGSEKGLDVWFRVAKKAEWTSLQDVRKTYPNADGVTVGKTTYTVFNISGNHLRLIVEINYRYRKIFIKHVLTHAEYDKGGWKQ